MARGMGHKYRPGIGTLKPETPPSSLNYEMWRGPAPMKPYSANQVHYNWHWFWDTGNGDLGNLAVHGLDVVRMALGLDGLPDRVQSMGGNFVFNDAKETPNFQTSVFRYTKRNVMLEYSIRNALFQQRGRHGRIYSFKRRGTNVMRTPSSFTARQGTCCCRIIPATTSTWAGTENCRKERIGTGDRDPVGLGISRTSFRPCAVGNSADLAAEAEEGRKSAALCHLANIAYRVGEDVEG